MIFGDYEIVQEFLSFLCKSCYASFAFAHKIIWFLKSTYGFDQTLDKKIYKVLYIIQTIFKSNTIQNEIDSFYLIGGEDYMKYIVDNKYDSIYFSDVENADFDNMDIMQKEFFKNKFNFHNKMEKYYNNEYNMQINKEGYITANNNVKDDTNIYNNTQPAQMTENNLTLKIEDDNNLISPPKTCDNISNTEIKEKYLEPNEIYINIYKIYGPNINNTNNKNIYKFNQIDIDDMNLTSFLSNISFIDHLCSICDILLKIPQKDRKKKLLNEIHNINLQLPANVYLPFVKDSIRNYLVASIPVSELKIFKTKERAPYMITLECFRLDELNYYNTYPLKHNTIKPNISTNRMALSQIKEEPANNKKENDIKSININKMNHFDTTSQYTKLGVQYKIKKGFHRLTNSISVLKRSGLEKLYKKNKISRKQSNDSTSSVEKYEKKKKTYLYKKDQKINKPIIVNNLLKKQNNNDNNYNSESHLKQMKITNCNTLNDNTNLLEDKVKHSPKKEYKQLIENETSVYPINTNVNADNKKIDINEEFNTKYEQIDNQVKNNFLTEIKEENLIEDNISNNNSEIIKNEKSSREAEVKTEEKNEEEAETENEDEADITKDINDLNKTNLEDINFFGETYEEQTNRLKVKSPFGELSTYKIFNIIVKSGEDLRQEQFATQLINEFLQIFKYEKVKCWLHPYEIIATGPNVGIVEVISNSITIDQMKKKTKNRLSLSDFYKYYFGPTNSSKYKKAVTNYCQSLAGYSLVCYFLQIKDRHNGNIMVDNEGHLIHIDFGFMLSNAPGKGLKFEKAPFKLTNELVDVMGGTKSKFFKMFRNLMWKGFLAIVEHHEKILILVEMMFCGHGNKLPCFIGGNEAINELRTRFEPKKGMSRVEYLQHVDSLIKQSLDNWRTNWYDKFQYYIQGILP